MGRAHAAVWDMSTWVCGLFFLLGTWRSFQYTDTCLICNIHLKHCPGSQQLQILTNR